MPEVEQYCRTVGWLIVAIGLAGCDRGTVSGRPVEAEPVEFRIPAIPARAPIETARLNSNVLDSICHIGNPFAVAGWDLDAQTRFLYFVGPFEGAGDGLTHPFLYMAIPAPDRANVTTTLSLDRLDEAELRKHAKPDDLRRFQLLHLAGLPADAREIRRQLGEPAHARQLDSGLTRLIFERDVCLGKKRLVGIYVDVDDDRLVAAKGVDHPDRLKWIVSAGRPPQPDQSSTYYQDWKPREDSPQEAALAFVFSLENRDVDGARTRLWQPDSPPQPLEDFASLFADGSAIDTSTLTYRTTRHGLDFAEVAIAFVLSDGRNLQHTLELRDAGEKRWRVSDWRRDAPSR